MGHHSASLTFPEWHRRWPDFPGHGRLLALEALSKRDQDACWDHLAERSQLWIEAELELDRQREEAWCPECREFGHESPCDKRRTSLQGTPRSTSTGTSRVQFDHSDPLKRIPASEYVTAFTGVPVPASGKICCPLHDDRTPSFKAYGSRWHCFGCGGDGDIYDLASALTGLECRGADFIELRRRVAAALLGGWLHG
jgi:CHC2 zinc finger